MIFKKRKIVHDDRWLYHETKNGISEYPTHLPIPAVGSEIYIRGRLHGIVSKIEYEIGKECHCDYLYTTIKIICK